MKIIHVCAKVYFLLAMGLTYSMGKKRQQVTTDSERNRRMQLEQTAKQRAEKSGKTIRGGVQKIGDPSIQLPVDPESLLDSPKENRVFKKGVQEEPAGQQMPPKCIIDKEGRKIGC